MKIILIPLFTYLGLAAFGCHALWQRQKPVIEHHDPDTYGERKLRQALERRP